MNQNDQSYSQLVTETNELRKKVAQYEKAESKRKQKDAALLENLEKYKALFEYAPLSYQSLDQNGNFLDINSTWLQTLGYERDEVIGQYYGDFLHPDWNKHFEKNFPAFKKRGHVHNVRFKIRHKQGHYIDIAFDGCIGYHPDGSFKQTYCVFKDITERLKVEDSLLKSERQSHTLFENAEISIWNEDFSNLFDALEQLRQDNVTDLRQYLNDNPEVVMDLASKITVTNVNKATLRLFGEESTEKFLAQITNTFGPGADEVFINELCAIWGKQEFFRSEARFLSADGRNIDAIISFRIPSTKEGMSSIPVSIIDITELKQIEAEHMRAQRKLQQTYKMEALGQLTGGIAHDFNNILAIIMGYTNMIHNQYNDKIPDKALDYLTAVITASERARSLVSQMMTFSRSDTVDKLPLQIAPLIKENIKMMQSILPSSIDVEFQCEADLPDILMDPAKLQQIIINLCLNSKDAMKGVGSISINLGWQRGLNTECTASHDVIKGDWIELSVTDTGCGIPAEDLKHIFEPFYTTKKVGNGTGMGLSVLHGILSSYAGHAVVESVLDKGTTFRLLFPPLESNNITTPETNNSSSDITKGDGQQILVVDDEPGLANYLGKLLTYHNFQATVITDSKEALSLFLENVDKFSLLITDQTMPGLTGVELVDQLRKVKAELPVILCTGYSENIDEDTAVEKGICFLNKPVDANLLIQKVVELLNIK